MANNKSKLTDRHRTIIVRELACFTGLTDIQKKIKDEYGIEIKLQSVQHYDPNRVGGSRPAKRWVELFNHTREAFLSEIQDTVPLAHKSVRIKELALAANLFKRKGNYLAMAKVLEQIAKEVGNVHTNRHEITGKDGGAIRYSDVGDMTDEQIRAELLDLGVDPDTIHASKTKH